MELNCKSWTSKINVKHTVAGRESADTIKTDDDSATPSKASVFGIGVYTDTPGSPSFEGQLDTALDLVGRGGWVTIFLCSWRTHTTSCVNRTTTHDPTSSAMLQAAYDRGLNVVARLGNPYVVRDHADDSTRRSFRQLGAAYARLVASLPAPPATSRPLYVQVGNELNACNEWHCSDAPNVTMSGEEMAKEVAAFARDVAISLIPLRNGSVSPNFAAAVLGGLAGSGLFRRELPVTSMCAATGGTIAVARGASATGTCADRQLRHHTLSV